jgi:hypothetical protein
MRNLFETLRFIDARSLKRTGMVLVAAFGLAAAPAASQVETFDPDDVFAAQGQSGSAEGEIDADLVNPGAATAPAAAQQPQVPTPVDQWEAPTDLPQPQPQPNTGFEDEFSDLNAQAAENAAPPNDWALNASSAQATTPVPDIAPAADSKTYAEDDLIGAAEGVFGKGAEGLAGLIEDLLRKQGEPNGYIVGREAGGAFVVGARYGSGTLHHKVEGTRKVYWTGPSIGLDAGANAANSFVLVYNLYDTEDLFKRFPAGEGQAYLVGGMHVSYVRRGDIVLIPIRVGAGLRLGVNAGYLKFSKKQRWLPF